jgi:hypothetical protein
MEIVIISLVAFLTAILTFFSGFGLGTILTPVMMLFFPVEIAIGLTGIVHFFNNIFKLFLVGNHANREVLIKFGIPAVLAALLGSWLLFSIPDFKPLFTYSFLEMKFEVYPVKFMISILLLLFALMDIIPFFSKLQFSKNKLPLGGFFSGFFGGLSGIQGALRSAFLIKAGLSKEVFIATAVVISTFVDFTRLSVYATQLSLSSFLEYKMILICAILSAILGAFLGNKLLKKVTIRFLQITVAILLIFISLALGLGWI